MAKFYGAVGYAQTIEQPQGVWTESIVEKKYYGDVLKRSRRLESSGDVNDNITISNEISIVADPYAVNNFTSIRYVTYMNTKWKVSNVDVDYPRLILTTGGIYNGN